MKIRCLTLLLFVCSVATAVAQTTAEDYYKLAIESVRIRDNESVKVYATKAIELDPTYSDAYMLRASVQRDHLSAIADYTKVIELGKKKVLAYEERALRYLYNQEPDATIADYDKVIEFGGTRRVAYFFSAQAYGQKAWAAANRGETDLAKTYRLKVIDLYTKAIAESKPGDGSYNLSYSYRSVTHSINKDYALALADINVALKLQPDFVDDLKRRLDIYRATGQKELAAADEQRIYELTGSRPK
jgi:tetratricopeptide (TPR) repeat protein